MREREWRAKDSNEPVRSECQRGKRNSVIAVNEKGCILFITYIIHTFTYNRESDEKRENEIRDVDRESFVDT